jgi:hypothetical protein
MVRRKLIAGGATNQYGVPSTIVWNLVTTLFTGTHPHPEIISWTSKKSWKMMATRKLFAGGATNQYWVPLTNAGAPSPNAASSFINHALIYLIK